MTKIFHPLLALITSASDKELAKYVQFLNEENKILRSRVKGQIHTKPEERERLLDLGKELGRPIEELITIVSPKTFYRWIRERDGRKRNLTFAFPGLRERKAFAFETETGTFQSKKTEELEHFEQRFNILPLRDWVRQKLD